VGGQAAKDAVAGTSCGGSVGDADASVEGEPLGSSLLTKSKDGLPLAQGVREQTSVQGQANGPGQAPSQEQAWTQSDRQRGLLLVGLFKLGKALFFAAVGAGALHLVNRNMRSVLMHVVDVLGIDPERHFVSVLLDHVQFIDPHELRKAGVLSFLYAAVCVVEGAGLVLKKRWAGYFTVILTALGLPWEGFELLVRFSLYKLALLAINFGVLLYLLWILKRRETGESLAF
jgi:uncharacterized membrane protein (DUF2068 family)